MSVLSDHDIIEAIVSRRVVVTPLDWADVQPSSIDLHLGSSFRELRALVIDSRRPGDAATEEVHVEADEPFLLYPGRFALGVTVEKVELPDNIVARIEGLSSLGRVGLVVHSTAGYVDPGWKGELTLELSNNGRVPIELYGGSRICQIAFQNMSTPVDRPYGTPSLGSHYQHQRGATAAKS